MVDSRFNKSHYLHNVDICAYFPNTASIIYVYISQYMSQFSSHTHAVHISWWSFLIALLFFKGSFYLKGRIRESERQRQVFQLLVHTPKCLQQLGLSHAEVRNLELLLCLMWVQWPTFSHLPRTHIYIPICLPRFRIHQLHFVKTLDH